MPHITHPDWLRKYNILTVFYSIFTLLAHTTLWLLQSWVKILWKDGGGVWRSKAKFSSIFLAKICRYLEGRKCSSLQIPFQSVLRTILGGNSGLSPQKLSLFVNIYRDGISGLPPSKYLFTQSLSICARRTRRYLQNSWKYPSWFFLWNIIRMIIHGLAQSHAKGV